MERVNIIGAGLAGLSAAITLAKSGVRCSLISSQASERAQSVMAEGGINAALDVMGEHDTTAEHFADTMKGGVFLADPNAVNGLTSGAPEIVNWLHSLGVPFQYENGHIIQRNFGGQKKKRTAYAKSSTGKVIMTALIDEARKYEAAGLIERYSHHTAVDIVISGGACTGAVVRDVFSGETRVFPGKVILANGGLNGFFPGQTTGTTQNTGDLAAVLFSRGVEFANLEFIQYHPTTAQIQGKRMLISEAARGEGGRLFIERGGSRWYFMEKLYPELGNLMPRDVVSREMYKVLHDPQCGGQTYLDMTALPQDTWKHKLSDLRSEIIDYLSVDPVKEPVAVSPGIHFFMGGIYVNEHHETSIPGLYAAGECACQYHGANRLGGNSMLGALYGGKTAAHNAAVSPDIPAGATQDIPEPVETQSSPAAASRLCNILLSGLGIIRDEQHINAALKELDGCVFSGGLSQLERRRFQFGRAMLMSALERRESRGAHTRSDFPERSDEDFLRTTIARVVNGRISIEMRSIPQRRAENEVHA